MYRVHIFQGLVIHLVILTAISERIGQENPFFASNNEFTWIHDKNSQHFPITPTPRQTPSSITTTSTSIRPLPSSLTPPKMRESIKKESYVERIIKIRAQRAQKAALNYKLKKHVEDLYWLTRLKRGSRAFHESTLFRKDTRRTTPPPERRINSAAYKPSTTAPFFSKHSNQLRPAVIKNPEPTNLISSDHNKIQLHFISNNLDNLLQVDSPNEINAAQASKKVYSYITTTTPSTTIATTTIYIQPATTTTTSVIATSTTSHPTTEPLPTTTTLRHVIPPTPTYEVVTRPVGRVNNAEDRQWRTTPHPFGFPIYYKPSYYSDPQWYKPHSARSSGNDFFFPLHSREEREPKLLKQ